MPKPTFGAYSRSQVLGRRSTNPKPLSRDDQMSDGNELVIRAVLIGIGATILFELWNTSLKRIFGIPSLQMRLLGRWLGHFSRCGFVHANISDSASIKGERLIGWCTHYAIGVTSAFLLIVGWGLKWARQPTLLPALLVGLATLVAPFFLLQPGMGAGIAASKTPRPNAAGLKSIVSHTIFGFGLYLSAVGITMLFDL